MMEAAAAEIFSSDRHLAATIGRNTFFGVAASVVQVGTRLVTVPFVIHHLGLGGYGIWSIIMTTATYMRFGGYGVNSAFQKYVAEATGNGDFETANKLLSTGAVSMLGISVVGLIPIAVFSQALAKILRVPDQFLSSAAGAISVLALILIVSNFAAVFHAIVAGGHRLDLLRKFNIVLSVCEAVAIIILLHFGHGLLAMAAVMGTSEMTYLLCCYLASLRVVPEIHISMANVTHRALRELFRYAGSYQLVNILEMLYSSIVPVAVLRFFGADAAGVYAVTVRVVTAALMAQNAMILPVLSGATLVFASGSAERTRRFLAKSFKVTLTLALPPLAFVSVFGGMMVLAWTGQTNSMFHSTIWLVSLAALYGAFSRLQTILYRASGRALLDNIHQVLRIVTLLIVAMFGRSVGFYGVLGGLAVAELIGVVFMFFAISATFRSFTVRVLLPDTLKLIVGTAAIISAGLIASLFPIPWTGSQRMIATLKLGEISLACLLAAWPALTLTKAVSAAEGRTIWDVFLLGRKRTEAASG
jgi:O-antigen/teichoic acid export membrane protein